MSSKIDSNSDVSIENTFMIHAERIISTVELLLEKSQRNLSPYENSARDMLSVLMLRDIIKGLQPLSEPRERSSTVHIDAIDFISGYNRIYKVVRDCHIDVARSSKMIYVIVASAILLRIENIEERDVVLDICDKHLRKEFPFPKDWRESLFYFQSDFLNCGINDYVEFLGYDEFYIDAKTYLLAVLYIIRIFSPRNLYLYITKLREEKKDVENFKQVLMFFEITARKIIAELPPLQRVFWMLERQNSAKYPVIFDIIE